MGVLPNNNNNHLIVSKFCSCGLMFVAVFEEVTQKKLKEKTDELIIHDKQ